MKRWDWTARDKHEGSNEAACTDLKIGLFNGVSRTQTHDSNNTNCSPSGDTTGHTGGNLLGLCLASTDSHKLLRRDRYTNGLFELVLSKQQVLLEVVLVKVVVLCNPV